MPRRHRIAYLPVPEVALALGLLISPNAPAQNTAPVPLAPLPFPNVSDMASSPLIFYHSGLLTIQAHNSTLADVLKGIAEATGAMIDFPEEAGTERIAENAGPAPADEVLSRLLNGSRFDFIIAGSSQDPHAPTHILLMLRAPSTLRTEPAQALATIREPGQPQLYGAGFTPDASDDDSAEPIPATIAAADTSQGDAIPGEVLDQMQKERLRQRQAQMQQQTAADPN